jgi:hypothetical protein
MDSGIQGILPGKCQNAMKKAKLRFDPLTLKDKLGNPSTSFFASHFALKKEVKKYDEFIGSWQHFFTAQHQKQSKDRLKLLQNKMGAMCNVLKGASSAPITRIKIDTPGKTSQASFTTDPAIIDQQL